MKDITNNLDDALLSFSEGLDLSVIDENYDLKSYTKYPIAGFLALGGTIADCVAKISQTTAGSGGIYRCIFPKGVEGTLAMAKDGSGALGTIIGEKGIVGQARWEEVGFENSIDFSSIAMSAVMLAIEMKIGEVIGLQEDMMEFLEADKESKIKGSLKTLAEIVNDYKYNCDNDNYKKNQHIIVAEMKKEANQDIVFYRDIIKKTIDKSSFLKSDHDLDNRVAKTQRSLKNYQLAIYLYSFSSFLEVMLLQNFKANYIDSILSNLTNLSLEYRQLYTDAFNKLDADGKSTINQYVRKGLSSATKATGEIIAKNSKLENSKLDDFFVMSSKLLDDASERKMKATQERLISSKYGVSTIFIESLQNVKELYNSPIDMIVDKEYVYFKCVG